MDGPPTLPVFPPPTLPDGWPVADHTTDRTLRDGESDRPLRVDAAVLWEKEPTIERLWAHVRRIAIAVGMAAVVSAVAMLLIGSATLAFDNRSFGQHQRHFFLRFWLLFPIFVVGACPVTVTLMRSGRDSAIALMRTRRYWKVIVGVFVVLPVAVALAIFVATNVVMILLAVVVLIVLFVMLAHLGAF